MFSTAPPDGLNIAHCRTLSRGLETNTNRPMGLGVQDRSHDAEPWFGQHFIGNVVAIYSADVLTSDGLYDFVSEAHGTGSLTGINTIKHSRIVDKEIRMMLSANALLEQRQIETEEHGSCNSGAIGTGHPKVELIPTIIHR